MRTSNMSHFHRHKLTFVWPQHKNGFASWAIPNMLLFHILLSHWFLKYLIKAKSKLETAALYSEIAKVCYIPYRNSTWSLYLLVFQKTAHHKYWIEKNLNYLYPNMRLEPGRIYTNMGKVKKMVQTLGKD